MWFDGPQLVIEGVVDLSVITEYQPVRGALPIQTETYFNIDCDSHYTSLQFSMGNFGIAVS